MSETEEDRCSICLEGYEDVSPVKLECGHAFHPSCAVTWFRTPANEGRCPLCRGDASKGLFHSGARERYALLRRKARAASAPKKLKSAVEKLRKIEATARAHRDERRAYFRREDVKEMIKETRRLRTRGYADRTRVHRAKLRLAYLDVPELGIPTFTWRNKRDPLYYYGGRYRRYRRLYY